MKLQLDKCDFFKQELESLDFVVSVDGVKTNPKKVESIINFPYPNTLKELRSLLGLFNYYSRFIKGFTEMAKPSTNLIRGNNGRVSRNESSKIKIYLKEEEKKPLTK